MKILRNLMVLCVFLSAIFAQTDTNLIKKIKTEAIDNSQIMDIMMHLTTLNGPRLTNSKGMKSANDWTKATLESYGLKAWLEPWGEFGRGWDLKNFHATVTAPYAFPLIAYPKAWSPSTKGLVKGKIIYIVEKTLEEIKAKYAGKLKGAIILKGDVKDVTTSFDPIAKRLDDKELLAMANSLAAEERKGSWRENFKKSPRYAAILERDKIFTWINSQQPALYINNGNGNSGTFYVQQASGVLLDESDLFSVKNVEAYKLNAPVIVPQLAVANEQFNQIAAMIKNGLDVYLECNLEVEWQTKDLNGYNTIGEWEGTDLKDQVVMIGGHLDSWHGATGATDNASGSAVMMEAIRILKKLEWKPRRTIRVGLWSGEEQGIFGSEGYVKKHFGRKDSTLAEFNKFSAYYNLDNGTGQIRGIYLQGNDKAHSVFRNWLSPFKDWNANTLTLENTGGTDHLSFNAIGLPGFQFIQDEIDYDTRTHHTNMDLYDRILDQDMKRNAAIIAYFVFQSAMMDEMIPRK